MLKLISFLIKTSFFIILVLVMSHLLSWNGKTVSDRVRTHLAQAEHFAPVQEIKSWASKFVGSKHKLENKLENISLSERQKLKSLIRELNSTGQNSK